MTFHGIIKEFEASIHGIYLDSNNNFQKVSVKDNLFEFD